ncbi:11760_t:CDS:10 [Ambispora leptoticha]|uniref:11760_t:CDS:1 n=1 Tax=Ambispora leptoticha TaxID=144679 RepID=A0A9N8VBF3_9GLOM|nr:11760_t:CDS:10 [Ambispora leptoticha]
MAENYMQEIDVDFFEFRFLQKNKNSISISPEPLDETKISTYASLLAISNKYGYLVAGTKAGFMITRTQSLRQAFKSETSETETVVQGSLEVKIPKGPVEILKISADELTVFAEIKGGIIQLFDVTTLLNGEASTFIPYREYSFNQTIRDIRPNPGPLPNVMAILFDKDGSIELKNFIEDKTISTISPKSVGDQISAMAWSPKGKHLMGGTASGKLIKFDTDGSSSTGIQPPPDLSEDGEAYRVLNVLWLEKSMFFVSYYPMVVSEDSAAMLYLVSSEQSPPTFTKIEATPWKSSRQDRQPYYFMETIRDWGSNIKNLVILADALSTDTACIASDDSGEWAYWILESSDAIVMPIPRFSNKYDDTLPFGMAIDFTDTEEWLTKFTDETVLVPPVPIVYIINDEGDLLAYRCFNKEAFEAQETCANMVVAQNIPSTGPSVLVNKHLPEPEQNVVVAGQVKPKPLSKITESPPEIGITQKKLIAPVSSDSDWQKQAAKFEALLKKNEKMIAGSGDQKNDTNRGSQLAFSTLKDMPPIHYKTPNKKVLPSPSKATLLNEDNIRDVERFLKELKKKTEQLKEDCIKQYRSKKYRPDLLTGHLYKDVKLLMQKFFMVKQKVSDLNDDITKAHRLIEYVGNAMDPESKPILPDRSIKSLSDEAMRSIRESLETIKDAAQVVEERIILLHDLIEEKKKKNIIGRSPLEMIESSIRNITITLMHWQKQLNTMGDEVQQLYAEKQKYRSQIEQQENIEQSLSSRELDISSYLRYSPEAGKQIDSYLKQTHMMKRIGNKLRNRKIPILTRPEEGDQGKATTASSKVIGNITTYSPNNILETSHKTRPPIIKADSLQTTYISSLSISDNPTKNILQTKESTREKRAPFYMKSKHVMRAPESETKSFFDESLQNKFINMNFLNGSPDETLGFGLPSPTPSSAQENFLAPATGETSYPPSATEKSVNNSSNETSDFGTPSPALSPAPASFLASANGETSFPPPASTSSQINTEENVTNETSDFGTPSPAPSPAPASFLASATGESSFPPASFLASATGESSFPPPASTSSQIDTKETVNSSSNETSGFGIPFPAPESFIAPATGGSSFPPSTSSQINAFGAPSTPISGLAQPTFGQPAFGQPAFGQPAFGQPAFGQPAFGQPAFGQPAFGQPAFGQPSFGQPAFGQPSFGQSSFPQNPSLAPLKAPSGGGFARFAASGTSGAIGFGKSPDPNATPSTTNTNMPNNPSFTQFRG